MKPKPKLSPSWEIYNRILWDKRLHPAAFSIRYTDRMDEQGYKEKELLEWDAHGDIPWHRVQAFLCAGMIVWDREARTDLLATDELPAEAWALEEQDATPLVPFLADFMARPVYAANGTAWQPLFRADTNVNTQQLRIVSWNILCDDFEKDTVCTEARIPVLLQHLSQQQPDVIALQEVTGKFYTALLAQDWAKNYYLSDAPDTANIYPHGIVLLSKFPFTQVEHRFSQHKRLIVARFSINGQPLHLVVVHLTSDRSPDAAEKRKRQLQTIVQYTQNLEGTVLIAGDFNNRDQQAQPFLAQHQYIDCWDTLHPDQAGYTFDTEQNTFAKLFSLSGQPARLDGVFGRLRDWQPRAMHLFGTTSFEWEGKTLFPSDHFALCLDIQHRAAHLQVNPQTLQALQTAQPTHHTAVVLIPSEEVNTYIQPLRRQYDAKFNRWMPHITLLYGFVPNEHLEAAAKLIASALYPFTDQVIRLEGYDFFDHRQSSTAWLKMDEQGIRWLQQIQQAVQPLFPLCKEQSSHAAGFQPHLSIGQFTDIKAAKAVLPAWKPRHFTASKLAVISRTADTPFQIVYEVEIGTGTITAHDPLVEVFRKWMPMPDADTLSLRQWVMRLVSDACSEVMGQPIQVEPIGSSRLGVISSSSDLDLLCCIPDETTIIGFLEAVRSTLTPFAQSLRLVADAQVPILKMTIEGIAVDVLVAIHPFYPQPITAATTHYRAEFDPTSWQALGGLLEANYLIKSVANVLPLAQYGKYLRGIRAWAKARQLTGNGWGWLGSFSWTVAATYCLRECLAAQPNADLEQWLRYFFERMAGYDWSKPLGISPESQTYSPHPKRDRMPIMTATAPVFNSARNITRSTLHWLQKEWKRAREITAKSGAIRWAALLEPYDLAADSAQTWTVRLSHLPEQALAAAWGWVEGNFVGLLIQLEQETGQIFRPMWDAEAQCLHLGCAVHLGDLPSGWGAFWEKVSGGGAA